MTTTISDYMPSPIAESIVADTMNSQSPFQLQCASRSDRGRRRESNEDCFVIAELTRTLYVRDSNLPQSKATPSGHRAFVLIVADGVGGHQAGEVASGLSIASVESFLLNTLRRFSNLKANEEQSVLRELQDALFQADSRICAEADEHPEWRGMATTMTFALAVNWRLYVAHVGDSRCYLQVQGGLQQVTHDHTLTADMVRSGLLSPELAKRHPYRHVVTNILGGSAPGVQVELHCLDLHPHDRILLCSDGLTDMVSEPDIAQVLAQGRNLDDACERLVQEANRQGGNDNITVIVAEVGSGCADEKP
ncbi:MAG: PP2C family serine/threonine-protein phosphatase [Pirellulaceae bacterium]|nr:PP2C family serine/threonine-protein phosphatase [Pirellulaceae bacterium]